MSGVHVTYSRNIVRYEKHREKFSYGLTALFKTK